MIYACSAWELAADTYLLKLQRLQNKVLCSPGYFQRSTQVYDLHTALNLLYVYDIINYAGNKQKSYKIMRINRFAIQDKAKPDREYIRGLHLAVVKVTPIQMTKLPL
jgi:hypothetical protein